MATATKKVKATPNKTPSPKQSSSEGTLLGNVMDIYLVIILVSSFAYLSFLFVSPFLPTILWAIIFSVSLYPIYKKLEKWLGGRYKLSATIIAILGLGILIAPTMTVTESAVNSAKEIVHGLETGTLDVPPANESVKSIPIVGQNIFDMWDLANSNVKAFVTEYADQIKDFAKKATKFGTGSLLSIGQMCLSVIFASVFMVYAPSLSPFFRKISTRISANNGDKFIDMTSKVIQNVAKGVLGVALIQAGLAAVGFFGVGMTFAPLWTLAVFAMSIVQIPILIIVPAIIYIWTVEPTITALIFTCYMFPVTLVDNFLKPILMAKGLTTPIMVIFIGVIGGTFSMGLLGLFIGPVVMALFYHMFELWMEQDNKKAVK